MCETTSSLDISVVIPVHNVADYLEECLSSLHCQTLQSAEFIVINDGSTDGCAQICDKYSKLDARFKVVHQDSRGTLVARKRAFAMSKGKWCICVDGDDKLPFNRVLEIEVALANKIDVDILRFDMDAISEKGEKVQKELSFRNEWIGTVYSPYEIIKKIDDETLPIYHRHSSVWSMVIDVNEKIIYLTDGTPCKFKPKEYKLS